VSAPLSANADLERLKGLAKSLRDLVRAGDEGAIELVRANHPRHGGLRAGDEAAIRFRLSAAQLTLARHHGFASWPKLRAHVELVRGLARSPHTVESSTDAAAELLRLGCLDYGTPDPQRADEARALLAARPELASASVHTLAATADAGGLAAALAADPEAANRQGGPFGWEPLLYLTYSRLDTGDPVAAARALLAHGADPNAGYLWDGLVPPFTALTGVLGGGERQESVHPRWRELATVLLDAGADPNDHQAAYNRSLGDRPSDDVEWLDLLHAYGLGRGDGGPWRHRLGDALPAPADLFPDLLQHAAEHDLRRRAAWLLAHGADPNRPALHPLFDGRTPYQEAMRNGNVEIADMLTSAGADTGDADAVDRAVTTALSGDATAGGADAEVVRAAVERDPLALVRAGALGRVAAVRALVSLGWDVNTHVNTHEWATPLHEAAFRGHTETVEALLELGADPTIRDHRFNGTPAGWAHHGGHPALAARLEAAEQAADGGATGG
jgi:Ankyrin repeats (3 copies)